MRKFHPGNLPVVDPGRDGAAFSLAFEANSDAVLTGGKQGGAAEEVAVPPQRRRFGVRFRFARDE
jgi:hypothetical protein